MAAKQNTGKWPHDDSITANAGVSQPTDQLALTDDYLGSLIELAEAEPYAQFAYALRGLWQQRDELAEVLRRTLVLLDAPAIMDKWGTFEPFANEVANCRAILAKVQP